MINELYQLSVAMSKANIAADSWHREYKPIPNINASSPCVRILFSGNQISALESVDAELGQKLRKYGNNQGTFPAMNLAPLYRITDEQQCKELTKIFKAGGGEIEVSLLKSWCTCNNWGIKFSRKYKNSMREIPTKLKQQLQGELAYEPILELIEAAQAFVEPQFLHAELERVAFLLLEKKIDSMLALRILFYAGKQGKSAEDDFGSLSVILDCEKLEEKGISSATVRFTKELNQALQMADAERKSQDQNNIKDAFGIPFAPLEEPMPTVKLAGGFEVTLRTMFKGQPCQKRYGYIENATYPIAPEMRSRIQAALTWLSSAQMRDKTWVSTDVNEILFIYPTQLPNKMPSFTGPFQRRYSQSEKVYFESEAKDFAEHLTTTKIEEPENYPDNIQIFMLHKLDRARTKIIYTNNITPNDIILRSSEWQAAAQNLPKLPISYPSTPFPMKIAEIMNRTWKEDGSQIRDNLKRIPTYHGMELLFGVQKQILENDLNFMLDHSTNMILYAGKLINSGSKHDSDLPFIWKLQDSLVLIGMILYWLGSRKEDYMEEYSYLLGQLLKVSDSLHELYCHEVRERQMPPQLVGNSLYVAASEMPTQTIAQLGRRMMPYIAWAKANRGACIKGKRINNQGEEIEYLGLSAGYLLYVYEQISSRLIPVLENKVRFCDYEKAKMFLGYLSAFPQVDKAGNKKQD